MLELQNAWRRRFEGKVHWVGGPEQKDLGEGIEQSHSHRKKGRPCGHGKNPPKKNARRLCNAQLTGIWRTGALTLA